MFLGAVMPLIVKVFKVKLQKRMIVRQTEALEFLKKMRKRKTNDNAFIYKIQQPAFLMNIMFTSCKMFLKIICKFILQVQNNILLTKTGTKKELNVTYLQRVMFYFFDY